MIVAGFIAIRTTALSADSAVARMVKLVEEAQKQRSKTELLVEKIAKYYTPGNVSSKLKVNRDANLLVRFKVGFVNTLSCVVMCSGIQFQLQFIMDVAY